MADLRNEETMVSEKNDNRKGPAGTRDRERASMFFLVGGSSDIYDVTLNFENNKGHWCQKESGVRCNGNGNGKSRTYGKPPERDRRDPQHWCKHVKAAMADVQGQAEAAERSEIAFGAPRPVADTTPLVAEPVKVAGFLAPSDTVTPLSAAERLAALDAERDSILETLAAEKAVELRTAVAKLLESFDYEEIKEALKDAA